jgi:hypothetical protein
MTMAGQCIPGTTDKAIRFCDAGSGVQGSVTLKMYKLPDAGLQANSRYGIGAGGFYPP